MPIATLPSLECQPDYNTLASELAREGIEPFFLMFWLQGLREPAFWRFEKGVPRVYWHYTPKQRQYLEKTGLLADYKKCIPQLYKLKVDVTPTGSYSGWDDQFREHDVQFCKAMDRALVWIHGQARHLVQLHRMDASHTDPTKWICREWLQYQFRHHARDIVNANAGVATSGDTQSQQSQECNPKQPAPGTVDAASRC